MEWPFEAFATARPIFSKLVLLVIFLRFDYLHSSALTYLHQTHRSFDWGLYLVSNDLNRAEPLIVSRLDRGPLL